MSEQKENLRKAEASLQDAEKRLAAVRKWQPLFKQAVLEYHASIQRIKDLAAADVPRAVNLLTRMIDSLEAYLRVAPPSGLDTARAARPPGTGTTMAIPTAQIDSIATTVLDEDEAAARDEAQARPKLARADSGAEAEAPDDDADGALDPDPSLG